MKRSIDMAVVAAGLLALAGCGAIATGSSTEPSSSSTEASSSSTTDAGTPIEQAAGDCFLGQSVADEGMSLSFDTEGDDDWASDGPYDTFEDVACVLYELETPDFVIEHIDSTRALDGQQTDEWDHFEARWTYHPDSGMQMTVIDRS